MKRFKNLPNSNAVSEVIGSLILISIAVLVFSAIYLYVFPLPSLTADTHVKIDGYVDSNGYIILEHAGGESFDSYRIVVRDENGTLLDSVTYVDEKWGIGGKKMPSSTQLVSADEWVQVTVYKTDREGQETIFDGMLKGNTVVSSGENNSNNPYLISSLLTNTTDEDLICFNKTMNGETINASFSADAYVYNWKISGNPLASILFPMEKNNNTVVKDYSGNEYNGLISNAIWNENGKIGGCYYFNGQSLIDDIDYCFSDSTINDITVEVWVKTNESTGTILSYNREKYFDLGLSNGKIRWGTSASSSTDDTIGSQTVSDNQWHHIAVTYSSLTGVSSIFVDGILDVSESSHSTGSALGNGDMPTGEAGKGSNAMVETIFSTGFETTFEEEKWNEHNASGEEETWDTLTHDDFESGWGNFEDGGLDCTLYTGGTYAYQGSNAANIMYGNYGGSFSYDNRRDVHTPGYKSLQIDFHFRAEGIENGEYFSVEYYDGSSWNEIETYTMATDFTTGTFYHEILWINESSYTFPTDMDIRFRCFADHWNDDIYIDEIYVNVSTSGRKDYSFELLDSSSLQPYNGSYSLGGYGDFDPEYVLFNRSGIDLSDYYNVTVSFYYKYDEVESSDFFGCYYLRNGGWQQLLEKASPSGESSWTKVETQIPDDVEQFVMQFKWMSSSDYEFFAIDDLTITGSLIGDANFTGYLDSLNIYERRLSEEQIYQNYLCGKDGESRISVIVSEETVVGQQWSCAVTPVNETIDAQIMSSDVITIIDYGGG